MNLFIRTRISRISYKRSSIIILIKKEKIKKMARIFKYIMNL